MSLYSRLLFGYGLLFVLLLVSAVGAAVGFNALGSNIGAVLDENVASVRASMLLLESLEAQDRLLLAALLDGGSTGSEIENARGRFMAALDAARNNVTIEGEAPLIDAIDKRFAEYLEARDALLASSPERPLAAYEAAAFPLYDGLQTDVRMLLDLNHRAMADADRRAQRTARARAAMHGLLVGIAALALIPLARTIGSGVLDRLTELSDVAGAVAAGDRQRRVRADRNDELGRVGRQFNAMLDRQLQFESDLQGRLAEERRVPMGLLSALPYRAAVLASDGRPVASTFGPEDQAALELAVEPGDERLRGAQDSFDVEAEDASFQLRRLREPSGREVGWLARRPRTESSGEALREG